MVRCSRWFTFRSKVTGRVSSFSNARFLIAYQTIISPMCPHALPKGTAAGPIVYFELSSLLPAWLCPQPSVRRDANSTFHSTQIMQISRLGLNQTITTIKVIMIIIPTICRRSVVTVQYTAPFVADCGGSFRGPTGIISIPSCTSCQGSSFSCHWLISTDEGQGITFTLKNFDLSSHAMIYVRTGFVFECCFPV